ncbi:hypothetical protein [Yoonia sp. MH D7]
MGDTSQMVVETEVYQTVIGPVMIGDPVGITADTLDVTRMGIFYAIGLEIHHL